MSIETNPNASASLLARALEVAEAALLHEAMGKRGALSSCIKAAYAGAKVCGFALPIRCIAGDNLMLHKAISVARAGDVMIATVGGFREAGVWGEIASVAAMQRGIRGFVTDGSVRDVDVIAGLGFPVFSAGVSIGGTTKKQEGTVGEPIVIGNQRVEAGDLIVGDTDGVVVVPRSMLPEAIASAHAIRKREAAMLDQIRAGALTIDALGLRETLDQIDRNRKG